MQWFLPMKKFTRWQCIIMDEKDIEIGNPINCQVVVNHTVELTCRRKGTSTSKRNQTS